MSHQRLGQVTAWKRRSSALFSEGVIDPSAVLQRAEAKAEVFSLNVFIITIIIFSCARMVTAFFKVSPAEWQPRLAGLPHLGALTYLLVFEFSFSSLCLQGFL